MKPQNVTSLRPPKSPGAHLNQAIWVVIGVLGFLVLAGSGYALHGLLLLVIAGLSVAWIEYTVRETDQRKVLGATAVIVALLAAWRANINRRDDTW